MKYIIGAVLTVLILVSLAIGFHWTVNRVYVPQGKSLQLRYKGPFLGSGEKAKKGYWAEEGQVGVLKNLRGPGRHFYCPLWWECKIIDDIEIRPGEVGIVKCNLGKDLPAGDFLVDGDIGSTEYKGVLRKALGPGRYRINTYGYAVTKVQTEKKVSGNQVKYGGWVEIPTGYVGVITNLADNPLTGQSKGIQKDVLPPGIYPINSFEQQVDIVEIGYRETTVAVEKMRNADGSLKLDEAGEPSVASGEEGINFPSNDGFPIQMDFTAIWGLMPEQAPHAVATFGNIDQVENKVVQPQIESICRNNGSKMGAVELLIGESREQFQTSVSDEFQKVLLDKNITLLYGLVRHIYIPQNVREPIQKGYVSDELKLTREAETQTARIEAMLRQAEREVELEAKRVVVDTTRLRASELAEGEKEAKEIEATTKQLIAKIDRETAELDAQKTVMLGRANSGAKQLSQEAEADKFRLAVEAFGTPAAYNKWQFAEQLPESLDLKLLYAGEGTLWTDLKGVQPTLPVKK